MRFSNESLQNLEKSVSERLSTKRFKHTLGVVKAAVYIAAFIPSLDASELSAAALLHDVAKEIPESEAIRILKNSASSSDDADLMCPPAYHSFIAPEIVKRDFSLFATDNVLSAVKNHTTGSADMTDFDMVIFISDYIEEGRSYRDCAMLREKLRLWLRTSRDSEEARAHLYDAVIECLDNTIRFVLARGLYLHEKTVSARRKRLFSETPTCQ